MVWRRGIWATTKAYLEAISTRREVSDAEQERVSQAIGRLHDLQNCPFQVVELSDAATEEQVADIFVRINSEGVTLIQADFILTLMWVFWEKGRRDLEEFCRASRLPSSSGASPFNSYPQPRSHQLLRATVAVAFRRAVLTHIYTLLRGRDVETGEQSTERRDAQFARLAGARGHVLNLTHWHGFRLSWHECASSCSNLGPLVGIWRLIGPHESITNARAASRLWNPRTRWVIRRTMLLRPSARSGRLAYQLRLLV